MEFKTSQEDKTGTSRLKLKNDEDALRLILK